MGLRLEQLRGMTTPQPSDVTAPSATKANPRHRGHRLMVLCWCYLILALAAWLFLRAAGERWWLTTVAFLFGPRFVLLAPALALTPLALFLHRRALLLVITSVAIILFPV